MRLRPLIAVILAALTGGACSLEGEHLSLQDPPTGRVFGGPSNEEIFAPFQGEWSFEQRTLDPPLERGTISGGSDISISGHIIRFAVGPSAEEFRLCQTRATDDGIVCEAWHHEDIYDPGDMQRAECRLRRDGNKLVLHYRFAGSADFSDDPIIASPDYMPPNRDDEPAISPWWKEVYSRKSAE